MVYSSLQGYGKKAAGISAKTYSSYRSYGKKVPGSVKAFHVFNSETLKDAGKRLLLNSKPPTNGFYLSDVSIFLQSVLNKEIILVPVRDIGYSAQECWRIVVDIF